MNKDEWRQSWMNAVRCLPSDAIDKLSAHKSERVAAEAAVTNMEQALKRAERDRAAVSADDSGEWARASAEVDTATKNLSDAKSRLATAKNEELAAASRDWQTIEELWAELWREDIALLLRTSQKRVPTLVQLRDALSAPTEPFEPWLSGCQRLARRLMKTIELEAMVEERTFADYRTVLEQAVEALHGEATVTRESAEYARWALNELRPIRKGSERLLDGLQSGVEGALRQATELVRLVGEPVFKTVLADAIRPVWRTVDREFGTWQRRARPSLFLVFGLAAVALPAYAFVAATVLPSSLVLLGLLACVAAAAIARYYSTRGKLIARIESARSALAALDPDRAEASDVQSLWNVRDDAKGRVSEAIDLRLQSWAGLGRDPTASGSRRELAALGTAVLLAGLAALWAGTSADARAQFTILGQGANGAVCRLSEGRVLWAGPWQLVVNDLQRGLTVLPASAVTRVSRAVSDDDDIIACSAVGSPRSPAAGSISVHTTLVGDRGRVALARSIVLPVFSKRVSCTPDLTPDPWVEEMLDGVVSAFIACAKGTDTAGPRPVVLDVRGFADPQEFVGCPQPPSRERNLALAEDRRNQILRMLRERLAKSDVDDALIMVFREGTKRWTDLPEMSKESGYYRRSVAGIPGAQSLPRFAEIRIEAAGNCASEPADAQGPSGSPDVAAESVHEQTGGQRDDAIGTNRPR